MKNSILVFILIIFFSCSKSTDNNQITTSLEGNWLLQNIPNAAKLTFQGQNWMLNSGSVTIKGTFKITNNKMNGIATSRSGISSDLLQPDNFTGNISISNNIVTFTNFSGNWFAAFSSWYGKQ